MTTFGIDVFIKKLTLDGKLKKEFQNKRIALVGHPASVLRNMSHSIDALLSAGVQLSCAFGPQHGMRGEKQDNMIESDDYIDPIAKIPVFSLYGTVRRPTKAMMDSFDIVLFDLQDVGCRIYTYISTLFYVLEESAKYQKKVVVLDRPNPIGRPIEGLGLHKGWESFVGAVHLPMRHGLTLGEAALWMKSRYNLDVDLEVVACENYLPSSAPGFGWPEKEISWVNPSPNIPTLCTARCYPGTVMLEGTNLSEGRGTTRPLQIFGAPKIEQSSVLKWMSLFAPQWMRGCLIRSCYFEPTFHKYKGELCSGFQIHVDDTAAYNHTEFKPYRLMLLFFKAIHHTHPGLFAWRQPPYEYEHTRLPIDLICGDPCIREWVDNVHSSAADLEQLLQREEKAWLEEIQPHLLYK